MLSPTVLLPCDARTDTRAACLLETITGKLKLLSLQVDLGR